MSSTVTRRMEWLLFLLFFAVGFGAGAAEAPGKDVTEDSLPSCFGELTEVPLPKSLEWANDVCWMGEQEVAISAYKTGVVRLRLEQPGGSPITEIANGGRRTAAGSPWSLAVSDKYLAVGATMFAVGWKLRGETNLAGEDYFEFIPDIDLQGDHLLVLGLRKTEDGTAYEEDGAFVWLGTLAGSNLKVVRPLAFSPDGASAQAMNNCGGLFVGAVRFLENGSFVVVPIAEPGILLFRPNGRLARTWKSEELGVDGGCNLSKEQARRSGLDLELRMNWIDQRKVVDDILPLGGDRFGLLVRRREAGMTRWRMEIADTSGKLGTCEVPLAATSRWVNLRADRRGGRVVLLQLTRLSQVQDTEPVVPPRLLIAPITLALDSSAPSRIDRKQSNKP